MLPIVVPCFRLGETFAKFLYVSNGPPLHFVPISQKMDFQNSQRPPFTFFGTMRLTGDKKIQKKFEKKNQKWIFLKLLKCDDFLPEIVGFELGGERIVPRFCRISI